MALKLGLNLGYWGIGPQRRGGDRGRPSTPRAAATSRSGWPSPTAPTWSACWPGSPRQTETIKLGAAIMQVPARPPAAAAMAGCTIDALSGGRFIFGFGPSGPQVSEGWYGVPYAKPWGRTREYVEIVRQIVAREGRWSTRASTTQLPLPDGEGKALKLNFHPVRNRIPIFVGAIGRKSVELAAEICRRLDPDLLQRRGVRGRLGRAPRGRAGEERPRARRPRDLADAAGRDRRRPRRGSGGRQGRPAPLLRRHGQPQDQLLRRPRASLRLRRGRRRGAAPLPRRRARGRLRGDPRRGRRRNLTGRHRGAGRRANRALPRGRASRA